MADMHGNKGLDLQNLPKVSDRDSQLVSWVMAKVIKGREIRDQEYGAKWDEYTRLWRGVWAEEDQNRSSERSKFISPALQQAVEMTVAEMEEAVFGKKAWFDVDPSLNFQDPNIAIRQRDQLLEDFDYADVEQNVSKVFLLGALYGTGIAKVNVRSATRTRLLRTQDGHLDTNAQPIVIVELEPIRPDEFVIDPAARYVDEALYCAHEFVKPLHTIREKQKRGKYKNTPIGPMDGTAVKLPKFDGKLPTRPDLDDAAFITEYYGKVPRGMIEPDKRETKGSNDELVEAIVTIANESVVLRAQESPYTMKDRPILAYQHDTVPGTFWGRGVAEKGYNSQKALDTEYRARIDSMALAAAPMMGADQTRLGRNGDFRVRPGKIWMTRGRPSEILEPVKFGEVHPALFQHTADFERMVQMGTGAMDTATPLSVSRRNETASGMSMIQSAFIKRSKRTMQNVEREFIQPFIKKALWRYMQFDPERYPQDMNFVVYGSMGIMAKEYEQQQLTNLLGYVPPESPAFNLILKAIFDNSSSANRQELNEAMEALLAPPSEEEQQMQQIMQAAALEKVQLENQKLSGEVNKLQAEIRKILSESSKIDVQTELEDDKVMIQMANAAIGAQKVRQDALKVKMQGGKSDS